MTLKTLEVGVLRSLVGTQNSMHSPPTTPHSGRLRTPERPRETEQPPGWEEAAKARRTSIEEPDGIRSHSLGRDPDTLLSAWRDHDAILTEAAGKSFGDSNPNVTTPWWLFLWGFRYGRPRSVLAHGVAVASLLAAAVAYDAWDWKEGGEAASVRTVQVVNNETTLVLAAGVVASLVLLHLRGLGEGSVAVTTHMLTDHAGEWGYDSMWTRRSRWSNVGTVLCWVIAVVLEAVVHGVADRIGIHGLIVKTGDSTARIAAFTVISGLFSALTLYVQHITNGLISMVDCYIDGVISAENLDGLKSDWNVLQALLRRSTEGVAPCLLTISLTPMVLMVLCALEVLFSDAVSAVSMALIMLPKLVLSLSLFQVALGVGKISGVCARLPVFLNSILLGGQDDTTASRLIHFIERSRAGFYAYDMKVDFAVMSKFAYLIGAVSLTMITKLHMQ